MIEHALGRFDDLGRIHIPRKIRNTTGIENFGEVEIISAPMGCFFYYENDLNRIDVKDLRDEQCVILRRRQQNG